MNQAFQKALKDFEGNITLYENDFETSITSVYPKSAIDVENEERMLEILSYVLKEICNFHLTLGKAKTSDSVDIFRICSYLGQLSEMNFPASTKIFKSLEQILSIGKICSEIL